MQGWIRVTRLLVFLIGLGLWAADSYAAFDLRRWDRSTNLNLDGQWIFVPHRLLEPTDLPLLENTPHRLIRAGDGIFEDYGTYILRLGNPLGLDSLALFHGLYYTSAKSQVFCGDQPENALVMNLGRVATVGADSSPKMSTFAVQDLHELGAINPCEELVIMLQISSFHHAGSGMWLPPRLGPTLEFHRFLSQQEKSYAFILGILLFVSFYAASFAWRRPEEKTAVYVALGGLLLGLRIACLFHAEQNEEGSGAWLWHLENFCIYSAAYLVPYLSLRSLNEFLPGTVNVPLLRVLDAVVIAAVMIQLLTPVWLWTKAGAVFILFGVICVLMVIAFLVRAIARGNRAAWPHLSGVLLAFSGMLMEMLVVYRVIDYLPLNISGYGSALWISIQLQLAAQRFAEALEKSEYLSQHLSDEVEKQTARLVDLNRYIAENVLRRFLPPTVVADIVAGKRALDEKARALDITVLFADLCDFTRICSELGPDRTAMVLNSFLIEMTETVFASNGTIDKFLGDGVLVLFGAPEPMDPEAQVEAAWRCATRMHEALKTLNQRWQELGWPTLRLRIGIHCGSAVVGSFGGPMRSDYTAIGDTVNVAARIQAAAAPDCILISEEMARLLPAEAVRERGYYSLKGIAESRALFELLPWDEAIAGGRRISA